MEHNRKLYAELKLDEAFILKNTVLNGREDTGDVDYVENEFGWLQPSGISLEQVVLSDDDDCDDWARYIDYVHAWAFENNSNIGAKIDSFEVWQLGHRHGTSNQRILTEKDANTQERKIK